MYKKLFLTILIFLQINLISGFESCNNQNALIEQYIKSKNFSNHSELLRSLNLDCLTEDDGLDQYEKIDQFLADSTTKFAYQNYSSTDKEDLKSYVRMFYSLYSLIASMPEIHKEDIIEINYLMERYQGFSETLIYYLEEDSELAYMTLNFATNYMYENDYSTSNILLELILRHVQNLRNLGGYDQDLDHLEVISQILIIKNSLSIGDTEKALPEMNKVDFSKITFNIEHPFLATQFRDNFIANAIPYASTSDIYRYRIFYEYYMSYFLKLNELELTNIETNDITTGIATFLLNDVFSIRNDRFFCDPRLEGFTLSGFPELFGSKFLTSLCENNLDESYLVQLEQKIGSNLYYFNDLKEQFFCMDDESCVNYDELHYSDQENQANLLEFLYVALAINRSDERFFDIYPFILKPEEQDLTIITPENIFVFIQKFYSSSGDEQIKLIGNVKTFDLNPNDIARFKNDRTLAVTHAQHLISVSQAFLTYQILTVHNEYKDSILNGYSQLSSAIFQFILTQTDYSESSIAIDYYTLSIDDPLIAQIKKLIFMDLELMMHLAYLFNDYDFYDFPVKVYLHYLAFFDSSDISTLIRNNFISKNINNAQIYREFNEVRKSINKIVNLKNQNILSEDEDAGNYRFRKQENKLNFDKAKKSLQSAVQNLSENELNEFASLMIIPDMDTFFEKALDPGEQLIYAKENEITGNILVLTVLRDNISNNISYDFTKVNLNLDLIKEYADAIKSYPPKEGFQELHNKVSLAFSEYYQPCNSGYDDNVYLVTDGALREFPWHTLKVREDYYENGVPVPYKKGDKLKYIIETCKIRYLPSIQSAYYLKKDDQGVLNRNFIGIGNPNFSNSSDEFFKKRGLSNIDEFRRLIRLEETEEEVLTISKYFREKKYYLGLNANEREIKKNKFSNSFTYFATHSIPSGSNISDQPGLALTPPSNDEISNINDGLLTPFEIAELDFTNSYVSLSACKTYDSLYEGAEKYTGLPQAFFSSGANGLVLSMWDIESFSASKFNTLVIDKAASYNLDLADAIRETSLEFITDGKYSHPYFWGPYIYLGK